MDDRRQQIAATLTTLLVLAAVAWMECPPWQRELIRRTVRHKTYRLLNRLARASGRRAMGDELAGRQSEADAGYAFTFRLSSWRDRA